MSQPPQYFRLFANCVLVRGHARSTICDLQRGELHLIPNDLEELLTTHKQTPMADLLQGFDASDRATITEYYDFLVERQLGMFHEEEELGLFPDLDLTFDLPTTINNAIIDIGEQQFDYEQVINELSTLGCQGVQLRVFQPLAPERLDALLELFRNSRIRSIEIFLCYSPLATVTSLRRLVEDHPRITGIVIHSAPFATAENPGQRDAVTPVFTKEMLKDETHCGFIDPSYFTVSVSHFTEALSANTCLNQKIAIDQYGHIKNCPAMQTSFGDIGQTSLLAVATDESFTAAWAIRKDQVSVCKHCEFRYVCSDCRAFRSTPSDLFSKPAKCAYDPFTMEWALQE